jgi:hypothetical protein
VGNDFIVDHLHPNVEGYSLIAESFFNEIIKSGLAPKTQRNPAPDSILDGLLNQKFPFSELDSTIASLRIKILTGAYPFVPKGKPNKLIKDFNPVNIIDSLSIEVLIDGLLGNRLTTDCHKDTSLWVIRTKQKKNLKFSSLIAH